MAWGFGAARYVWLDSLEKCGFEGLGFGCGLGPGLVYEVYITLNPKL